jgi:hypothetical protein
MRSTILLCSARGGFGANFQFVAVQRYGRCRGTPDGRGTRAAPPHLTESGHAPLEIVAVQIVINGPYRRS